jgi:predicted O-methyltransferase YrrM
MRASDLNVLSSLDYSHPWCLSQSDCAHLYEAAIESQAKSIVELGTFHGVSAVALQLAANQLGASFVTVDSDEYSKPEDRLRTWQAAGLKDIRSTRADVVDFLRGLTETVDFIFHDSAHGDRALGEYKLCWEKLSPRGVLAVHDVDHLSDAAQFHRDLKPASAKYYKDDQGRILGIYRKGGPKLAAVTLGCGAPDYAKYAEASSRRMSQFTGLNTVVLGNEELGDLRKRCAAIQAWPDNLATWALKLKIFDYVDADTVLYHDADVCCVDCWDTSPYLNVPDFVAVRDRTWLLEDLMGPSALNLLSYVNAGFFICNRAHHQRVLELAFAEFTRHGVAKFKFADQCAINYVLQAEGAPVRYLPKLYNLMDPCHEALKYKNLVNIHTCGAYGLYERNEAFKTTGEITWDLAQMRALAGAYNYWPTPGSLPKTVYLLPDGSTSADFLWFATTQGELKLVTGRHEAAVPCYRLMKVG